MKKRNIAVCTVSMLCLTVFFLLLSVFSVVTQRSFYAKYFVKYNVDEATGMSQEDNEKAMNVLLDYLEDKRDDISVIVNKHGVEEEAFYERETLHMIDVKALYIKAKAVMYFSLCFAIAGLLYTAVTEKFVFSDIVRDYRKGSKYTLIIFLVFIAVIGAMVAYDFNWFWVHFHYVFFDNDLWLLDPRYSTMINMLPEGLFFAVVVKVIIYFVLLMALPLLLLTAGKDK